MRVKMFLIQLFWIISSIIADPIKVEVTPNLTTDNSTRIMDWERNSNFEIKCESPGYPGYEKSFLTWYRVDNKGKKEKIDPLKVERFEDKTDEKKILVLEVLKFVGFSKEDVGEYACERVQPDGYLAFGKVNLLMTGHCAVDGELHKVGERFVSISCTGACKCEAMNGHSCVSLCPPHFVNCPPGEIEVSLPIEVSTSPQCFCKRKKCVAIAEHCYFEDVLYTKKERFISKSCTSCQCMGSDSVGCVSLCPPVSIACNPDEMVDYEMKEVSKTPQCKCKKQTCAKIADVCELKADEGPCYALFKRWYYNPSSRSCEKFEYGGCQGNANRFVRKDVCEQYCSESPASVATYSAAQDGKPLPPVGDCSFDENWYKTGENFISTSCENCTCKDSLSVDCIPLCKPPNNVVCPPDTMIVSSPKQVTEMPKCFCMEENCVKKSEVCKKSPEVGSCYAHIRRWYYNPLLNTCDSFIYGGCEGNPNNFASEQMCEDTCLEEGTQVVKISGKIVFPPEAGSLPKLSCASIKLVETVSTHRLESTTSFSVSEMDTSQGIEYQIVSAHIYTPIANKTYTLSAVVNRGWCKDQYSQDWYQSGDYATDKTYQVELFGQKLYEMDIDVFPIQ